MSASGQNQANRNGHGVFSASGTAIGQVTITTATEVTLGSVLNTVMTASGASFAPFEIRILAASLGLELRSATGVDGWPVVHLPGAVQPHNDAGYYLAQNAESPMLKMLVANTTLADIILYVMCIG